MRILYLSRWFPYPPDNGSKIRIFNMLRVLSREHDIDLISFATDVVHSEHIRALENYCRRVEIIPYRPFQPGRLQARLGFLAVRPRSVLDTFNREMERHIQRAVQRKRYDLIIGNEIDMAPYLVSIPHTPKLLEDIELTFYYERYAQQAKRMDKIRSGVSWLKWERYIRNLSRDIQAWTVVSQKERNLLSRISNGVISSLVVPNCVNYQSYQGDFGSPDKDTLIYSGALTYHANFDAVDYFLREIFPLIQKERPGTRFIVTGKLDGVPIESLPDHEKVIFSGYLDDIRPAIAHSMVNVVPLRVGGGTRLKILESMAIGTPVVSTSKGVEGLDLVDGREILVADAPDDFAAAVLRLMRDTELRERLSSAGCATVARQYDWDVVAPEFTRFVENTAGGNGWHGTH
jgi:glycosyltransferase involved in cell wall biosynthesis